jgi:hypothetical protein
MLQIPSGIFVRNNPVICEAEDISWKLAIKEQNESFPFKGRWGGVNEHKDSLCPSLLKIKTTIILPMLNTNTKR